MVENASISSKPRPSGWMLVHPKMGIMWSPPGSNARQAWYNACVWDQVEGNGLSRAKMPSESYVRGFTEGMRSVGWRARRVNMEVVT